MSSLYPLLAGTALKGAVVLLVAWLVTIVLRRRSAAARHLVWSAAFVSLLLLPILSLVLPALHVPVSTASFPLNITFRTEATGSAAVPVRPPNGQPSNVAAGYTPAPQQTDWRLWFAGLWITGSAIAFAHMLISWVALRRLRARSVTYPEVELLKNELGIEHEVEVLQTGSGRMPMTFGWKKNVVLLPQEAAEWSEERRRIVLLHELAHVRRGDALAHLLGRTVVNLHWWNPLAWIAWRASIHERECAADDLVLSLGARASDYAAHLLEIARSMQSAQTAGTVAVAMARRSQLEGRLMAILDSAVNRRAPGRTAACITATIAALVILPLAALNAQETQRVENLRKQLEEARQQYTDSHPDVLRLKTELAQARSAQDPAQTSSPSPESTEALVRKLEELRRTYNDSHPDVLRLKKHIAEANSLQRANPERSALEAEVSRLGASGAQSKEFARALVKLGDWHRRKGNLNDARGPYTKALALLGDSPDAVPALIGLGVDALIDKNLDRAAEYLQKAQVIDPTKAGAAMMWTAVIRHQQNNVAEADSLFKAALAVQDPNSIDAAVTMDLYALFLRLESRADEARAMAERSSTIRKTFMATNAPVAGTAVHRIGGGVTPPSLVFKIEPAYSEEARVAKFQGTSVVHVEIGPDGVPKNMKIVRWLGLGLDEKAIEAISQWRFKPGTKNEEAVTVAATIEVNFRLL